MIIGSKVCEKHGKVSPLVMTLTQDGLQQFFDCCGLCWCEWLHETFPVRVPRMENLDATP